MSALIVTPPIYRYKPRGAEKLSVFLAGSIEMGVARDWQTEMIERIEDHASVIYNPRRADWNSSWVQSIEHADFNVQVNWELEMIEEADIVVIYFEESTKSPITLMELGFVAATKPENVIVCCPEDFWRKGNVDIMCERQGIEIISGDDPIAALADAFIRRADTHGR